MWSTHLGRVTGALMALSLHALPAYAAPAVIEIMKAHPPAPRGAACDGVVQTDGVSLYRVGCETVMSFASREACYAHDARGAPNKDPCVDAWNAAERGTTLAYHPAFGLLRPYLDREGLYYASQGRLRVSDLDKASRFGPFLDEAEVVAEAAVFGAKLDPIDFPEIYPLVKDLPGFRDAFLTEVRRRSTFRPSRRIFDDFYLHGVAAVMFWYWEHDDGFAMDRPLIDAMKQQVAQMDGAYGADYGGLAYQSEGKGDFGAYLSWARGYVPLGARDRLRVHAVGEWPPRLWDTTSDFGDHLFHGHQGWVRAGIGRDLLAVAREEYAAGRPAVAAVLEGLVATVNPIRVVGDSAEIVTRCDDEEGVAVVRAGPRYAFAKPVYDPGLPYATFHIDDPDMRSRLVSRTTYDEVEQVVQPATRPPDDVLARVAELEAQIRAIGDRVSHWYAWVGVRGTTDASVTGWDCDDATLRCTAQWQGGGASSFGQALETKATREIRAAEAEQARLHAEIEALLPPGSFAPAVVRTDRIRKDVTSTESSYDGTFVLSYRGVVRQFRGSSSWQATAIDARSGAVCEAVADAAEGLDTFFLQALGEAARLADTSRPTTDPIELAVRSWGDEPSPADVDALLKAVIGPTREDF